MEQESAFVVILGLMMLYSWIHGVVVSFKRLENLTKYEKVLMWFAFITLALYVVGTIQ